MQNSTSDNQLREVSNKFLEELKILEASNKWEKIDDKPCLYHKMEVDDKKISRAQVIVNISYQKLLLFFADPLFFKIVAEQVETVEIIYSAAPLKVIYIKMSGKGPISSREIVAVFTFKQEGNKTYLGNRSCNYPYKGDPDAIRAEAIVGGFILEKVSEGQTKITTITNVDIKGSIPDFIRNWMVEKRAQSLADVQQKIKAHLK